MQKQSFKNAWPVWAALAVPVLYLAAVAAYAYAPGMTVFDLMERFSAQLNHPLAVRWTAYTPRFLLGALALYAATIALYYSTRQNRRPGVEHGSAAWGDVRALDRKYRDRKHPDRNVILTQHLQMGLNGKQHRRNLLQIIIGGSGAGKTRFLVKPNVMLANASYICTDPKGEIVRAVGPLLLKRGYVLRVFDLVDPAHSDCYNPFRYIRKDADVFRLIDNLIKNTTPKNAANNDPFWEKSETALDSALMLYLLHEAPPEPARVGARLLCRPWVPDRFYEPLRRDSALSLRQLPLDGDQPVRICGRAVYEKCEVQLRPFQETYRTGNADDGRHH